MEPRWKATCQRQLGQNHQDLGLAVWRLPIDPDRALAFVSFFIFSSLVLLIRVMTSRNFKVRSVAYSPDGKQIARGSWDNTIKIWDSQSLRRLAISRLRVPNLDGFVDTAAGDLFSIGTPRHRKDPEIVRSQDTNQQKQRGKH